VEPNAAVAVLGFEFGPEADVIEFCQNTAKQAEVHTADELSVLLSQLVERAVVQERDPVASRLGLEPLGPELLEETGSARSNAGAATKPLLRPRRDRPTLLPGHVIERSLDGGAVML
jgi:hypothetical protein